MPIVGMERIDEHGKVVQFGQQLRIRPGHFNRDQRLWHLNDRADEAGSGLRFCIACAARLVWCQCGLLSIALVLSRRAGRDRHCLIHAFFLRALGRRQEPRCLEGFEVSAVSILESARLLFSSL